jgi:hypothetical protein
MHHRAVGSLCLVSVLFAGCIVPKDAKPTVAMGATFATKFVHRGITLVDNPVVQPRLGIALPTSSGDTIRVDVEANMDLRNDTGGGWFPDGHAGRFSQIEVMASYQKRIGDFDLRAGVHNYNLPNGLEFLNGERGATSEVFLLASTTVLEATPYVSLHYDFDEVRGGYYRAGCTEAIPLGDQWSIDLDGSLGYVSEAQASWLYGLGEAGLADLRGTIALNYKYDERTTLTASANGSAMMNSVQDRWFRDIAPQGIDDDPIWFTIAVGWVF